MGLSASNMSVPKRICAWMRLGERVFSATGIFVKPEGAGEVYECV